MSTIFATLPPLRTFTGRMIDLLQPTPEDIDIRDIAHSLSQLNRFCGHTSRPYCVAEHSVMCSYFGDPALALEKLLHDAAEAYIGDIASPLKRLLPQASAIENDFLIQIGLRFDVSLYPMVNDVKIVDAMALRAEMAELMGLPMETADNVPSMLTGMRCRILARTRLPLSSYDWEIEFISRFVELMQARGLEARINEFPEAQAS
jgi:5'-deoxynucleotidase YfbR-like HD superfamily hydrolase